METTIPVMQETLASFSFDLYFNLPYVQVQIEDAEPLWFILDTGSPIMVIDKGVAQRTSLPFQPLNQRASGAGEGTMELNLAQNISLAVGGIKDTYEQVYVLPIDDLFASHTGRHVGGLLGYDFFQRYVVEVDYAAHRIHLYNPATYCYRGSGLEMSFTLKNKHPHVAGTVRSAEDALKADFIIDTGAGGSVFLATPFVDRHGFLSSSMKTHPSFVGGCGGVTEQLVGRLDAVGFGRVLVEKPLTYFSQDQHGGLAGMLGADGVIGTVILRRYTVIWDYSRQRIILEPEAAHGHDPLEHDRFDLSGFYLVAEGADLKTLKVEHLLASTPATEAGLQIGDILSAVDGTPADHLTLEQIRQMFLKETTYTLRIRRGKEDINTEIKLRRLL